MNEHFHGAGGDQFSTYAPASVWTGNQGRAGYCRNTEYTTWGNGDGNKTVTWRTVATEVNGGFVRGGEGFGGLLEKVTGEVTGRFQGVPEWAYSKGAIVGMQGGEGMVEDKIRRLKEGGVR